MNAIAFLGTGNMASAMVSGLISQKIATASQIVCKGGKGSSADLLASKTGIRRAIDLHELLAGADTLVIAFKPQHLAGMDKALAELTRGKLVISVLAGKRLSTLEQVFPHARALVRCMPNTPSRIGAGVTGWVSSKPLSQSDQALTLSLLGALGRAIAIPEAQMDALTAVSGSGPAYVFEFAGALRDAGVAAGLEPDVANTLAVETLLGAAKLLAHRGISPEALRDEVTSPNGVTFAGLKQLSAGHFRDLVRDTVAAAKARSIELSHDS